MGAQTGPRGAREDAPGISIRRVLSENFRMYVVDMGLRRLARMRSRPFSRAGLRGAVALVIAMGALAGCATGGPDLAEPVELPDPRTEVPGTQVPSELLGRTEEVAASESAISSFVANYEKWARSSYTDEERLHSAAHWVRPESPAEGDLVRAAQNFEGVSPGGNPPSLESRELVGWQPLVLTEGRPVSAMTWEYCYVGEGSAGDGGELTCALITTDYTEETGWRVESVMVTQGAGSPLLPW